MQKDIGTNRLWCSGNETARTLRTETRRRPDDMTRAGRDRQVMRREIKQIERVREGKGQTGCGQTESKYRDKENKKEDKNSVE